MRFSFGLPFLAFAVVTRESRADTALAQYFVVKSPENECNATDASGIDKLVRAAIRADIDPNMHFSTGRVDSTHQTGLRGNARDLVTMGVPKCTISFCNNNPTLCIAMGCQFARRRNRGLISSTNIDDERERKMTQEDQHSFSVKVTKQLHAFEPQQAECDPSGLTFIFRMYPYAD